MPSGRPGAPGEGFQLSGFCPAWEDGRSAVAGVGTLGKREEGEEARGVRELRVATGTRGEAAWVGCQRRASG